MTRRILAVLRRGAIVELGRANVAVPGQLLHLLDRRAVFQRVRQGGLALQNPYDPSVTIVSNFLSLSPLLNDTITDSHFYERDRMGRLDTFLARVVSDNPSLYQQQYDATGNLLDRVHGIGIDEQTALLVDTRTGKDSTGASLVAGSAHVVANASTDPSLRHVYFVETPGRLPVCQPNTALTYDNLPVHRASNGDAIPNLTQLWSNLQTGADVAAYVLFIDGGVIAVKKQDGSVLATPY
jgi:cyanophycinase-like exopeptidase